MLAGEKILVTCMGPGQKAQEVTLVQMWPLGLAEGRPEQGFPEVGKGPPPEDGGA